MDPAYKSDRVTAYKSVHVTRSCATPNTNSNRAVRKSDRVPSNAGHPLDPPLYISSKYNYQYYYYYYNYYYYYFLLLLLLLLLLFFNPLSQVVFFHPFPLKRGGGLYQPPILNFANLLSIDLKLCMHIENLVIISNQ